MTAADALSEAAVEGEGEAGVPGHASLGLAGAGESRCLRGKATQGQTADGEPCETILQ